MANTGVTGKLVDHAGNPLSGMVVNVYDYEPVMANQFLGSATTGPTGDFSISYPSSKYEDSGEGHPDLIVEILDSKGIALYTTPVRYEVRDPILILPKLTIPDGIDLKGLREPGKRACCLLDSSGIIDPIMIKEHRYGVIVFPGFKGVEPVGLVYTCGAGFLDLGHLHDLIDLTRAYAYRLAKLINKDGVVPAAKGISFPFIRYGGTIDILKDIPESDVVQVARSMAYDQSVFHEIYTYWTMGIGMHNSSFSPEDLVSNWMGTYIGGKALRAMAEGSEQRFDRAATKALDQLLHDLDVCSEADSRAAFEAIAPPTGYWVNSSPSWLFSHADDDEYLQRRNFAVNKLDPWKVPGVFSPCSSSSAALPSDPEFDLPLSLKTYYRMELTNESSAGKFKMSTSAKMSDGSTPDPYFMDELIKAIIKDAKDKYGKDADKP